MKTKDTYNVFFEPGEVTEIRAYGLKGRSKAWEGWAGGSGVVYGYFDNPDDFGVAAEALEQARAPGIYFVLNPVLPDLLARACNRLKAAGQKSPQTADKDILCIRWLPVDLDPDRPSGISSSQAELDAAISVRNKIGQWMKKKWDLPAGAGVPAVSGNGAHLCYRLPDLPLERRDNPSEDPNVQMIKHALVALHQEFSRDGQGVQVDLKVYNPARIWKLYGTTARKGDHISARPHRKSYIEGKWLKGGDKQ